MHFLWFRNKGEYYILQKQRFWIRFKGISSKFPLNIIENQFCRILNLSKGNGFKILLSIKRNSRKFYIKSMDQINDMSLRKNFIFIASTKGKINIMNLENFQKFFYIDFLCFRPRYSMKIEGDIFMKLIKCSGIIIYC